jgi:hypothetical protein
MKAAEGTRRQAPQRGQVTLSSKSLSEDAKECEGKVTFAFSALFSLRFRASEGAKAVSMIFAEAGNVSRVKHSGLGGSVGSGWSKSSTLRGGGF